MQSQNVGLGRRVRNLSPSSSPHKVGKIGPKRPRTIVVRNIVSTLHEQPGNSAKSDHLPLEHYKISSTETQQLQSTKFDLFTYSVDYTLKQIVC